MWVWLGGPTWLVLYYLLQCETVIIQKQGTDDRGLQSTSYSLVLFSIFLSSLYFFCLLSFYFIILYINLNLSTFFMRGFFKTDYIKVFVCQHVYAPFCGLWCRVIQKMFGVFSKFKFQIICSVYNFNLDCTFSGFVCEFVCLYVHKHTHIFSICKFSS